ncbi:reverse transcriptase domain-containing protein [Tanacetum coccineum]
MVLIRAAASSTYILAPRSRTPPILHIPLPTSSLPLTLPSTDCRADVPEAMFPPRKRFCIAFGPKFEVRKCSYVAPARSTRGFRADYGFIGTLDAEIRHDLDREVGYGITNVWVDPAEAAKKIPLTTLAELSQRVTDFVTIVRQDTNDIYGRLDDAQSDRSLMNGKLNMLRRDMRYHANTALLVKREARAWLILWLSMKFKETITSMAMEAKGTEGVVGLTQWFEIMETVFNISKCAVENQVKFATWTLHGVSLTWWKSHVKTFGHDAAYIVPWNTLIKIMIAKYCPRNEIKKLEMEFWELKVKGTDLYVGGLPDMIHGSVMASKLKTMQDAVEFATKLMDKKIITYAKCQTKNKRKFEDTSRNNQNQQQQNKRQNTGRAYTAGPSDKRE